MPPDKIVELECQRLVSGEKGDRSHSQNTMSGTSAPTQRRRAIHHESSVTSTQPYAKASPVREYSVRPSR